MVQNIIRGVKMKYWQIKLVLIFCSLFVCNAYASILIEGPSGFIGEVSTLTEALAIKKVTRVRVTSPLSAVQSNISSATVHAWPADRTLTIEPGGSIANTTEFIATGRVESTGGVFKGTGAITINGPFSASGYVFTAADAAVTFGLPVDLPPVQIWSSTASIAFAAGQPYIPAEWWGAAGNGTTDDSVPMQAAIVASYSKKLKLVPGKKYLVGNLYAKSIIEIEGASDDFYGSNTGLWLKTGSDYILKVDGTDLEDIDYNANAAWTVTHRITGLKIHDVSFNGQSEEADALLWIRGCSGAHIERNTFTAINGAGLKLADTMEGHARDNLFRLVGNETNGAIQIANYQGTSIGNNVNNFRIDSNTFGYLGGSPINTDATPNTDTLWITDNKFEFDAAASWRGTTPLSVIKITQGSRNTIINNTFTNYQPGASFGYFETILKLGGTGPYTVVGNKMYHCDTAKWMDLTGMSGTLFEDDNKNISTSTTAVMSYIGSVIGQIFGKPVLSLNTSVLSTETYITEIGKIIPAMSIGGPNYTLTRGEYISGALSHGGIARVYNAGSTIEMIRCHLDIFDNITATSIRAHVRVKSYSGSVDSQITGRIDTNVIGSALTVAAADGWVWKSFTIPLSSITATSYFNVLSSSAIGIYIDCVMFELVP
jgi:hypothetical protein